MHRTIQLRLNPTSRQRQKLTDILAFSCELYNAAIEERKGAWRTGKSINYNAQQRQLTELNQEIGLEGISVDIAREPLRRVDRAFKGFFRRVKAGQAPGYPRFRAKVRYDSFSFHLPIFSGMSLKIPNLGCVKFKTSRWIDGKPRQAIIKRIGKRWVASILMDIGPAPAKLPVASAVGIDLGLTEFLTLSDGSSVPNPRWLRKEEGRIGSAHQVLARKKRGSKNRARAIEQLRRAYRRAADQRRNFCHHISKSLVQRFDLTAYEDLSIANMVKGSFSKSILDVAWGELIGQLTYKAENAGKWAIPVNPRGTTQKCSGCGTAVKKKLSERIHSCPACGLELGRDHNAAINVLALGMSVAGASLQNVCGDCI